ncbi:MAG: hypothetical protein CM15mP46_6700 [Alphaproteobacteria bacterium]|nr:MAG: hypothetical protein CM15mP46_6700 [Alphaproteobacteria bacterium]
MSQLLRRYFLFMTHVCLILIDKPKGQKISLAMPPLGGGAAPPTRAPLLNKSPPCLAFFLLTKIRRKFPQKLMLDFTIGNEEAILSSDL